MLAVLVAVLAVLGGVSHAQQTPCTTIGDLVSSRPDLSLIQKAVSASGYDVFLDAPGPKTFFAPNDAAFQKLNEDAGSAVLDLDLLDLLRYHTFGEEDVAERLERRAKVLERLETSCNGELVIIDSVLLPGGSGMGPRLPTCRQGDCCDMQPPGEFTCEEQAGWGKCGEPWMVAGGYCSQTCQRCSFASMVSGDTTSAEANGTRIVEHGILFQQWHYLDRSGGVNSLRNSRFMRTDPDYEQRMDSEDSTFQAPKPVREYEQSGSRISGFFCAPVDGDYTFALSSDDSSRLYMLPEAEIAKFSSSTSGTFPGDKDSYFDYISSQESVVKIDGWKRKSEWVSGRAKKMKRGEVVFLEVHHKNGGGAGHAKLAVELPGGETLVPIPAYLFNRECFKERVPAAGVLP